MLRASLPLVAPSATLLVALALVVGILLAAMLLRGDPLLVLLAVLLEFVMRGVWEELLPALVLRGLLLATKQSESPLGVQGHPIRPRGSPGVQGHPISPAAAAGVQGHPIRPAAPQGVQGHPISPAEASPGVQGHPIRARGREGVQGHPISAAP